MRHADTSTLQPLERAARRGLERLADHVEDARDAAGPVMRRMRRTSVRVMDRMHDAPVRSALTALAVGTLAYALVRLVGGTRASR
jgi:hypothetical protein